MYTESCNTAPQREYGGSTMSTLSELIQYCKEPDPVGALLLTGEWECSQEYTSEICLIVVQDIIWI